MHVEANTPNPSEFQDAIPLPDYAVLFRLHTWLENTWADCAHWDGGPPAEITEALRALEVLVVLALRREGMAYTEALQLIKRGE